MMIKSSFQAHPWLKNPHLQTILASKLRHQKPAKLQRERLELPDGDFVDLALHTENLGPMVCIFHGLQGNVHSSYAVGIINTLVNQNYNIAFMHFRGCSGEPNRLLNSYHSGHTHDIRFMIETLRARCTGRPLLAIAYSLGANALLKYLGEEGDQSQLDGAVAISPPLVLSEGAKRLNRGLSKVYQWWLVRQMQNAVLEKQTRYPRLALPKNPQRFNTFTSFDHNVTAVVNGFKSGEDYYTRCSARQYLPSIRRPTHIVFAADDPFFTPLCIPDRAELPSSVCFELSDNGGHVGFIEQNSLGHLGYWLERRIPDVLTSFLP